MIEDIEDPATQKGEKGKEISEATIQPTDEITNDFEPGPAGTSEALVNCCCLLPFIPFDIRKRSAWNKQRLSGCCIKRSGCRDCFNCCCRKYVCCLGNLLTSIGCAAFFLLTVFFVVGYIVQISAAGEQFINTESSNVDPEHIFTLQNQGYSTLVVDMRKSNFDDDFITKCADPTDANFIKGFRFSLGNTTFSWDQFKRFAPGYPTRDHCKKLSEFFVPNPLMKGTNTPACLMGNIQKLCCVSCQTYQKYPDHCYPNKKRNTTTAAAGTTSAAAGTTTAVAGTTTAAAGTTTAAAGTTTAAAGTTTAAAGTTAAAAGTTTAAAGTTAAAAGTTTAAAGATTAAAGTTGRRRKLKDVSSKQVNVESNAFAGSHILETIQGTHPANLPALFIRYVRMGRRSFEEHAGAPPTTPHHRRRLEEEKKITGLKQRPQSILKGLWGLYVILKAKGDNSNLLTPSALRDAKKLADIFQKNERFHNEFCWKSVLLESKSTKPDECGKVEKNETFACRNPISMLDFYYPLPVENKLYDFFGQEFYAKSPLTLGRAGIHAKKIKEKRPAVLVLNGTGDVLAPCALDEMLITKQSVKSKDNFFCAYPHQSFYMPSKAGPPAAASMLNKATANADAVNQALVKDHWDENSCALCNHEHCMCSDTNKESGTQQAVDSISRLISTSPYLNALAGKEFSFDNPKSKVIVMNILFGSPLPGFDNTTDGEPEGFSLVFGDQTTEFKKWALTILSELDSFKSDDFEVIYVWVVLFFDIIIATLVTDMCLAIGSLFFVMIYMAIHTRSCFLSVFGMFHILMSFPLAYCIYNFVLGIESFYTLSAMSVYVILAIGADDVFVFVDAFNQYSYLSLSERLYRAWLRATKAMAITSATTAGAFFVTASNPLNDISSFGVFTASLVIANFIYVITYYAGIVMFYTMYVRYCCCVCAKEPKNEREDESVDICPDCCRFCNCRLRPCGNCCLVTCCLCAPKLRHNLINDDVLPDLPAEEVEPQVSPADSVEMSKSAPSGGEHHNLGCLDTFCSEKFFAFIKTSVKFIFPTILVLWAIAFGTAAFFLEPTSEADQLLRDDHPFQKFIDSNTNDFGVSGDSRMRPVRLVFGLGETPIDRSGLKNKYSREPGKLEYTKNFDISDPDAQQFVVDICTDLYSASEQIEDEDVPLVRDQLGKEEVNCFMAAFKEYLIKNRRDFPVPRQLFHLRLAEWFLEREKEKKKNPFSSLPPSQQYEKNVHIVKNKVKAFVIEVNSTMIFYDSAYLPTRKKYDAWEKWAVRWQKKTPASIKSWFHSSGGNVPGWVFMHTQEVLIINAFIGVGVSLIIAFVILTISTLNPYIALLAILDITCVVAVILGFIQVVGWKLGQIESIAATILVGLAVDYVVHVANAYMESKKGDRESRVKNALTEMGGTVLGGAVTSLGASFFLLLCNFQFFAKFGVFMFMTIGLSFMFVFLFFVPILLLIGPEEDCCNLRMVTQCDRFCYCMLSKKRPKTQDDHDPEVELQAMKQKM